MLSNRELARLFSLYSELLQLHEKEERLSDLLSGAAYRIGRMDEEVTEMSNKELKNLFRGEVIAAINKAKDAGVIEELEELIQLTPPGLFDMMRIKGLGGKKLATLWKVAKIDTVESLADACRNHRVSKIPGFGVKTEQNIIAGIEALNTNKDRYHYADVADIADGLVMFLQKHFGNELTSLCGEVRRMATTVSAIEMLTTVSSKQLQNPTTKKALNIQDTDVRLRTRIRWTNCQ